MITHLRSALGRRGPTFAGLLGLLDPVEKYLPEFKGIKVRVRGGESGPDAGRLVDPEHPLTLRDLMTHASGMGDYPRAELGPRVAPRPFAQ